MRNSSHRWPASSRSRVRSASVEALEQRSYLAATLVKDITPTVASVTTSQITDVGDAVYFIVNRTSGSGANELYRTTGTQAGTTLVRTFSGGSFGPQQLTAAGGLLFYATNSSIRQVWRTDGTTPGTVQLTSFTFTGTTIQSITAVGNIVFFSVDSGAGSRELWRSDGTVAGTSLVKSLSAISNLVNVGGKLFFSGNDGTNGAELWTSDGTAAGTVMVKDLRPGAASSSPIGFVNVGGTAFFTASYSSPVAGQATQELWKTDGTEVGTVKVTDIAMGMSGATAGFLTAMGGAVYYSANTVNGSIDTANHELYRSDGTPGPASIVRDIYPGSTGSAPSDIRVFGGNLYFSATTPGTTAGTTVRQMWKSDGTAAGTAPVADTNPQLAAGDVASFKSSGGWLYFLVPGPQGRYVWRSDGTAAQTQAVLPSRPVVETSLTPAGGELYFVSIDTTGARPLVRTSSLINSTTFIHTFSQSPSSSSLTLGASFRGNLFFSSGVRLWRSDGTEAGTVDTGWEGTRPMTVGSRLVFLIGTTNAALWGTDGQTAVQLLPQGVVPDSLVRSGGNVYFFATVAGQSGLWKSDGTIAGTQFVKAVTTPRLLTASHGGVYFYAFTPEAGDELWRSDGTAAGTAMVADVRPGPDSSIFLPGYNFNRQIYAGPGGVTYFLANDGVHGAEVWRTDGTAANTALLKDINPGTASGVTTAYSHNYGYFGTVNGRLVFTAAQGPANTQGTNALWSSDGTAAGTIKIHDHSGQGWEPHGFTSLSAGVSIFGYGNEIWRTDGTAAGTVLLGTIPNASTSETGTSDFQLIDGAVYFVAGNSSNRFIWRTDGASVTLVDSSVVLPSANSAYPTLVDGTLFFPATTPATGRELFMLATTVTPAAPSGLQLTAISSGEAMITWEDNSDNESTFLLERSTDPTFATVQLELRLLGDTTRYEDVSLAPDTTYYYRVRAYNSGGASTAITGGVTTLLIPTRPTDVVATPTTATSIRVTWTDRSTNETGFKIERSTSADFATIDSVQTVGPGVTVFDDTTVVNAVTYHYRVRAFNAVGESPARQTVATTPLIAPAPTSFAATTLSGGEIALSWVDNAGYETGYRIERSASAAFTTIDATFNLPADSISFEDAGLSISTTYHYRIVSMNGVSASASQTASAVTLASPLAPTNVVVTAYSGLRVDLAWTDNATNEASYTVQRSTAASFAVVDASFVLSANATSFSDTTVAPLTVYYYRVFASNAVGRSGAPVRSTTTPELPPAQVKAVGVSNTRIDLQWTDTTGNETQFRIERSLAGGPFVVVSTVSANKISYSDTAAQPNKTYAYRIVSVFSGNVHSRSEPVVASTLAPELTNLVLRPGSVPSETSSMPEAAVMSGGFGYFVTRNSGSGAQLWRTDGTSAGTTLVKDFSSGVRHLTDVNGVLYFYADQSQQSGLWKSDGTAAGTGLVYSFGSGSLARFSNFVNYNGVLHFRIERIGNADGLWRSDGTAAGTVQVKYLGEMNGAVSNTVVFNGLMFFSGRETNELGLEIMRSDGTAAGTYMLKDVNPSGSSQPFELVPTSNALYFTAQTDGMVRRLWRTDGTTAGTTEVPGAPSLGNSQDLNLTAVGSTLFFTSGNTLWRTDGTAAGTFSITSLASLSQGYAAYGNTLLFTTVDASGMASLWSSDGTVVGTVKLRDFTPNAGQLDIQEIVVNGGYAWFGVNESIDGWRLYRTDGTAVGTVHVKTFGQRPTHLSSVLGKLIYQAYDIAVGYEPWVTDAAGNSSLLKDVIPGQVSAHPDWLTPGAGGLFFTLASHSMDISRELWWTDGSAANTRRLKADPSSHLMTLNGNLIFRGYDVVNGHELWRSDGTVAGTTVIKDILPGHNSSSPVPFGVVGGLLYFGIPGADYRHFKLWKTDGTAAGTVQVTSAEVLTFPDDSEGRVEPWTAVAGGLFYFVSESPDPTTGQAIGAELWRSDGTPAGTHPVADIQPGSGSLDPFDLTDVAGTLYFLSRNVPNSGTTIWKTNGTSSGTVQVATLGTAPYERAADNLTNINGTLYFRGYSAATGSELWKSDGTAAGTTLVADASPGTGGLSPRGITSIGGGVTLFSGYRSVGSSNPSELWRTDGTAAGTTYIREGGVTAINPARHSASANGLFFFRSEVDSRFWRSDGTLGSTIQLEFGAGAGSAGPKFAGNSVAVVGDKVFYTNHVGNNVHELRFASSLKPAAPSGLAAPTPLVPTGGASPQLIWTDNASNETGYLVDRSTSSTFTTIDQTLFAPADATQITDTTAAVGAIYYYRVRAVNAAGDSANSNTLVVSTEVTVSSWASVAAHGAAGDAELPIPADGTFSEGRSSGISRLVVRFTAPIDPASLSSAAVGLWGNDAGSQPIDLSGVTRSIVALPGNDRVAITFGQKLPDFAKYRIRLSGVTTTSGSIVTTDDRILTALLGDATGDRRTNNTDVGAVTSLRGINPINPATVNEVRSDMTNDGRINNSDVGGASSVRGKDARFIADPVPTGGGTLALSGTGTDPAVSRSRSGGQTADVMLVTKVMGTPTGLTAGPGRTKFDDISYAATVVNLI